MKKILTAGIFTIISTTSFANELQNQKLADLIASSVAYGSSMREMAYDNFPNQVYKEFGWKVDTTNKKLCVDEMFSDKGYAKMILPKVQQFGHTHSDKEIQNYIDVLVRSGVTFRKMMNITSKTQYAVYTKKISKQQANEQRQAFTKTLSEDEIQQLKEFTTNPHYRPLLNLIFILNFPSINVENVNQNQIKKDANQFPEFIAQQCHLK